MSKRKQHASKRQSGRQLTLCRGRLPANAAECTPVRVTERECCFSVVVLTWR
jgi:hypothetical protein